MTLSTKSFLSTLPQVELFQRVGEICAAVNSVSSEKELLEISLKKTMELFGASRGSIFILKENGRDLILKSAQGIASGDEEIMVKKMGEGIVGRVAQLKKPVFVEDISKDKRFGNLKARSKYRTPSFICAPLIIKDELLGVINITDKESGHRFSEEELLLLDFITSQIALNYRRIQLYEKFKKVVSETQSLKDKLGQSDQEAAYLKRQINIQEKLATIGKLAGGVAHEFNNPLDGVMRYTNLCLEHVRDDEVVRGYLMEMKQGLNRMANIVRNLLACSRNDTLSKEKVDFALALDHALYGLKTDIAQKNIKVHKFIADGLPLIQDLGLERIFSNLIRNAIDSMKDEGEVRIDAHVQNNTLTFKISDTGCGIEKKHMEQIFEPFFTTKDIDKGCGLGLTIVGEIVKSYDGHIDVESEVGRGTTFTIQLPCVKS